MNFVLHTFSVLNSFINVGSGFHFLIQISSKLKTSVKSLPSLYQLKELTTLPQIHLT